MNLMATFNFQLNAHLRDIYIDVDFLTPSLFNMSVVYVSDL